MACSQPEQLRQNRQHRGERLSTKKLCEQGADWGKIRRRGEAEGSLRPVHPEAGEHQDGDHGEDGKRLQAASPLEGRVHGPADSRGGRRHQGRQGAKVEGE